METRIFTFHLHSIKKKQKINIFGMANQIRRKLSKTCSNESWNQRLALDLTQAWNEKNHVVETICQCFTFEIDYENDPDACPTAKLESLTNFSLIFFLFSCLAALAKWSE